MEIKNAVIESASIKLSDGFLSAGFTLDYGDCGHQGFGYGYVLYVPKSWMHHKMESVAGHFIYRIMEIAGAESWDGLIGKTIRVKSDWSNIEAIGHIVKDDWFNPSEDFKNIK
ncbi:MAG: hypothetical protein WC374_11485 [Phycisphaerae bacterium]|jgi:hypothetical protein